MFGNDTHDMDETQIKVKRQKNENFPVVAKTQSFGNNHDIRFLHRHNNFRKIDSEINVHVGFGMHSSHKCIFRPDCLNIGHTLH